MRRLLRATFLRLHPRAFLRHARPTPHELGRLGEALAARHLRRHGWRVLARRLATPWGEVDLVLRRGETLACAEVKTGRAGPRFRPGDRLRARDRARLHAAARGLAQRARARDAHVLLVEVVVRAGRVVTIARVPVPEPRQAALHDRSPSSARWYP